MTPTRKRRLALVLILLIGAGTAVSLTVYALRQNINLFFAPGQIAAGEAPVDRVIRVGGLVVPGSVARDPESLQVRFDLTDNDGVVSVAYSGILPDLFREGQGIIARGTLTEGKLVMAEEVLAKHDETYMPPEVADALQKAGMPHGALTE
jgi:cytochrome c-type biogenesis protein CcmE